MSKRSAFLILAAGLAAPAITIAAEPQGLAQLREAVPGVRTFEADGAVRALYGKPMASGATAQAAADAFLAQHADAFGIEQLELEPHFTSEVMDGKFTVFGYTQTIAGIPVDLSKARVLVLNGVDAPYRVVYASGTLADATAVSLGDPILDAQDASLIAQAVADPAGAEAGFPGEFSQPELVVFQGGDQGWSDPVLTWKVTYRNVNGVTEPVANTTFIDATTGEIVHTENEIHTIDVEGTTEGLGTPGTLPDTPANPPVQLPMPDQIVSIAGGNDAVSDDDGSFTIPNGGGGQVTVESSVNDGLWVDVSNASGGEISASDTVTPPGPASLLFNPNPSEFNTAQVNAFVHTGLSHDYIKDRAPDFNSLDTALTASVNRFDLPCNAFFDGASINFMRSDSQCNNTAYTTVVAHEYGHFIVQQLGLGQGGFGEGYSDSVSMMLYDVCIVGEDFFKSGGDIRNPCTANQQFPCNSSSVHTCGQILGGTWGEIRDSFKDKFGDQAGLESARELHVAWSLITGGGTGSNFLNSAHPGTAIEVLTVDDDDGDIDNGTPNREEICDAFAAHNIDCPELELLAFEYDPAIPDVLAPGQAETFQVTVEAVGAEPEPGSGLFFLSIDGASFELAPITEITPNVYEFTIPAVDCGQTVEFFLGAEAAGGTLVLDPEGGEDDPFSPSIATDVGVAFADEFESNNGWTVGAPGDDATTGIWERVDPVGTAAQPENDHTPDGTDCFITGQQPFGGDLGTNDVDNGKTTLTSPLIDLSGASDATISYYRWYSNDTGNAPNTDVFVVDVSDDGGDTWTNVEVVGPAGEGTSGGWIFHEFDVGSLVDLTDQVRVRFVAEDDPSDGEGSLVEAGVDDFTVDTFFCEQVDCPGDFNGDGELNILDFTAFQGAFAGGDLAADCNDDGELSILDFICFQGEFAAGCP